MIDLHTHSTFSDGTLTPTQLLRAGEQAGLTAMALTDHNSVAGLPEFMEAAKNSTLHAIAGTEFSTEYRGIELHILGLYIPAEAYEDVNRILDGFLQRKEQSNIDLVHALRRAGIALDYDTIRESTPDGYVNRAVIAAEMVRLGFCESVKQAFSCWLSPKHGFYVPPKRPDALEVIRFIRRIGAVPVLAHPFLNLDEEQLRGFLPEVKKAGLWGMEVEYPLYDAPQTVLAKQIATDFSLAFSGGSDFHGANKPDISLGKGRGDLLVPDEWLPGLRKCVPREDI